MTTTSVTQRVFDGLSTDEITVVASDCVEEIDEALSIVHDGFVEAGYMAPRPSGRRLHPSYLNPGTVFFLAHMEGRAVGACALIADGPFGLPSDRAFAEENDAMRQDSGLLLHECGSLSVRSEARRHTRRIVTRIIAAMGRLSFEEYPSTPLPLAVTPENRRFYSAMIGAVEIAGPRPLYGAPAYLMRAGGAQLAVHAALRSTPSQRVMFELLDERNPSWLTERRSHQPLPSGWLQELLDEHVLTANLSAQLGLLAERHPMALRNIVRGAGLITAA